MTLWQTWGAQLGAVGLLAGFVIMIGVGRLIPRYVVKQWIERSDRNVELYRQASEASAARADEAVAVMREMMVAVRTLESLVRERQ